MGKIDGDKKGKKSAPGKKIAEEDKSAVDSSTPLNFEDLPNGLEAKPIDMDKSELFGKPTPVKKESLRRRELKPSSSSTSTKHFGESMDLDLFCAKVNCQKWKCRLQSRINTIREETGQREFSFLELKKLLDKERIAKG